jgi:diguanylate cyclase (GGDEF)-like protein
MIARWGGEEFALLLVDVSPEKAMEIAQKLCQAIKEDKVLTQLLQKPLTVSIGLGELSSLESQDGLVYKVDNALYEAKKAGKDQVVVA